MENNAAHGLLNKVLDNNWKVIRKIERDPNQSGSNFSVGYIVKKNEEECFLKAFDFAGFLSIASPTNGGDEINVVDVMNDMTTAFIYERDLSQHCKDKYVTKVSVVRESGQVFVEGNTIPVVPYLIFDLAEGDIRKQLNFSSELDNAWKLKSLHDVAVGLRQLHQIEVSHQDLKPSNVLVFNSESKIGDLGRSMCKDIDGPYNKKNFTGDWTYAPPEMMYRYYEKDWNKRVFATDCYLLGSLITFYFSGISMTALLRKHLPDEFSWEQWKGSFEDLVPYLENAFTSSLEEFEKNINREDLKGELKILVQYLCQPFPDKRGHSKNISSKTNQYSLERFIATLDLLRRKSEINLKNI